MTKDFASFCEQSGLQGRSPCRGGGGGREALRDVFGAAKEKTNAEGAPIFAEGNLHLKISASLKIGRGVAMLAELILLQFS